MDIESFNPHPHAGCDSFTAVTLQVGEVSIHTPTQGVTTHAGHSPQYRNVSIHTPTQGVTGGGFLFFLSRKSFNPHTHAGCDYGWHLDYSLTEKVSIHTPTQGVTKFKQAG